MYQIEKLCVNYKERPAYDPKDYPGVRAITYDGMPIGASKTKVFAYLGFPDHTKEPVPGIVLIHGGGGHAFPAWVQMWVERGYAAIAMDTTGFYPEGDGWHYGLYGSFAEEGYVDAPNNTGMVDGVDEDVEKNWLYHAVGSAILARKLLAADERVDAARIGVCGISWGGVITSILIGQDPNFAFAIPIYGSGHLGGELTMGSIGKHFRPLSVQKRWLAEKRFDRVKIPVLWLCWNDDNNFSIQANSQSYLDTLPGNERTCLSIVHEMYHSHLDGWVRPESASFASAVLEGKPLPRILTQPGGRSFELEVEWDGLLCATAYYITSPMKYKEHDKFGYGSYTFMEQVWQMQSCQVEGGKVSCELPEETAGYYVEIKTQVAGEEFVLSSVYVEL